MTLVIKLSLDVIQRFNPSKEDIVELINELQSLISVKTPSEKIKEKSDDEMIMEGLNEYFLAKLERSRLNYSSKRKHTKSKY